MNERKIALLSAKCASCVTKPCQLGCPLDNDITGFIKEIKNKNYDEAFNILTKTTVFMPICGRVCPHTKQCEGLCAMGVSYKSVSIGTLEAFVGDYALKKKLWIDSPDVTAKKVAVVGGGPSGLTCAAFLRRNGIGVTIYEKHDYLGGLLMHGIPDFRLPRKVIRDITNNIVNLGIEVKYNKCLGKDISLGELEKNYDAVYLAIGANEANNLNIPGEELLNVYGANELLEYKPKINYKKKTFVVIGGGNTAMDVARTIIRKGANVNVIYHKTLALMSAEKKEIRAAKKEGVEFIFNTDIVKINGTKRVKSVQLKNGDKVINMECNYVIKAIGSHSEKLVKRLKLEKNGNSIKIDSDGRTNNPKIFAGGDVAGTKSTVAWASRAGRNAAYAIIDYLNN